MPTSVPVSGLGFRGFGFRQIQEENCRVWELLRGCRFVQGRNVNAVISFYKDTGFRAVGYIGRMFGI